MKSYLRAVALLIALILCAGLCLSCERSAPPPDNSDDSSSGPEAEAPDNPSEMLQLIADSVPQYKIIRPEEGTQREIDAAVALNSAIRSFCGKAAEIQTDWNFYKTVDNEICVGDVARNGDVYELALDSLANNEFCVKVCGSRLVLVGNTAYGTLMAVEWFIENYLTDDSRQAELAIPADLNYIGSFELPSSIRIMTQNLLATDTEYESIITDSRYSSRIKIALEDHTIEKRSSRIRQLIIDYQPDSLGVQECSSPWRNYFASVLSDIGYARIGADKNQKIGIIYNKSTVKPIANGSFWLTEAPESLKISSEWSNGSDGLTERLGMYVVFEVIATGERYVHFNTHIDTAKNSIIQAKQVGVILDYIEKITAEYDGIPAVLTGDFNFNSDAAAYRTLISTTLGDTRSLCEISTGGGSFNKFIGQDYASLPIDQIMATKDGFIFNEYKVIYDTFNGHFASDHYAVIADISIKK